MDVRRAFSQSPCRLGILEDLRQLLKLSLLPILAACAVLSGCRDSDQSSRKAPETEAIDNAPNRSATVQSEAERLAAQWQKAYQDGYEAGQQSQ